MPPGTTVPLGFGQWKPHEGLKTLPRGVHFLQRRLPTAPAAMETSTGRLQRMRWWPRLSVESSRAWRGQTLSRCRLFVKCSRLHGSIKTINHPNNPPPSSTVLAKKLRANYKHTQELIITNVYVSASKWEKQRPRGRDKARVRLHCAIKELPIFIFEQETECNLLKGGRGGCKRAVGKNHKEYI